LARWPAHLAASAFSQLGQYANTTVPVTGPSDVQNYVCFIPLWHL